MTESPAGQELAFILQPKGEQLVVTDPTGRSREVTPPWRADAGFTTARIGFHSLTREPVATDAERAELIAHATVLGRSLFQMLVDDTSGELLGRAMRPGQPPLVIICS